MNSSCRFQECFLNLKNQKLIGHLRISMQFQHNMLNNQLRQSKLIKRERKRSRNNFNQMMMKMKEYLEGKMMMVTTGHLIGRKKTKKQSKPSSSSSSKSTRHQNHSSPFQSKKKAKNHQKLKYLKINPHQLSSQLPLYRRNQQ